MGRTTPAPEAPVAEVAPDAPEAPEVEVAPAEVETTEDMLTPQERRQRARAQARAAKQDAYFTPDKGLDWIEASSGGRVCVCNSRPNMKGETFQYLVYENKGKATGIPLVAVLDALDAEQF